MSIFHRSCSCRASCMFCVHKTPTCPQIRNAAEPPCASAIRPGKMKAKKRMNCPFSLIIPRNKTKAEQSNEACAQPHFSYFPHFLVKKPAFFYSRGQPISGLVASRPISFYSPRHLPQAVIKTLLNDSLLSQFSPCFNILMTPRLDRCLLYVCFSLV